MSINFRKCLCRKARKGSWLYGVADCKRYEPPAPIPDPIPDDPPPLPVCDIPYHKTGKLLVWSGTLLCSLSTKDNALFDEDRLAKLYDAMVKDGVNAERSFSYFTDTSPDWDSWTPGDSEYPGHLHARLSMIKERELTEIMCLTPYQGKLDDNSYLALIRETKQYLPNIIYECINEPSSNELQRHIVELLLGEGIPPAHIQTNYVDSGEYFDMISKTLGGKSLSCLHNVGSVETINAPWPKGWSTSAGTLEMMKIGLYPSNDGEDEMHAAQGMLWHFRPDGSGKRSSTKQGGQITSWSLKHNNPWTLTDEFGRGFEFLSAAGFQSTDTPDLEDAILLGREERIAMREVYDEIFG